MSRGAPSGVQVLPADEASFRAGQQMRRAVQIADVSALEAIECEGLLDNACGAGGWIDVAPMLDEREVSPRWLDLNRTMLDYALERGLIERHPKRAHLVRVLRRP